MRSTESEICYRTVTCTVCRRVCVHFSAGKFYIQAGAVEGLKNTSSEAVAPLKTVKESETRYFLGQDKN